MNTSERGAISSIKMGLETLHGAGGQCNGGSRRVNMFVVNMVGVKDRRGRMALNLSSAWPTMTCTATVAMMVLIQLTMTLTTETLRNLQSHLSPP